MSTFTLPLLQAVSDWQRGASPSARRKRGERLKSLRNELPSEFKECHLCCFRQIALDRAHLWKFGNDLFLEEKISSWTPDLSVAKDFLGGVPPEGQGYQGLVFDLCPTSDMVVTNLNALYADSGFLDAVEASKSNIDHFSSGMGKYMDSQFEVVLEVDKLTMDNVYALGGHSSSRDELAAAYFGHSPSEAEMEEFDYLLSQCRTPLGPHWVTGDAKDRVVVRMLEKVEEIGSRAPGDAHGS